MQINDVIVAFVSQLPDHFADVFLNGVNLVYMRIALKNACKRYLGKVMNFRTAELLLYAPRHGRGKHDVTDRAEADDEDL